MSAFVRRKKWEAQVLSAELMEVLGAVMVSAKKPKQVDTAEGLKAMGIRP